MLRINRQSSPSRCEICHQSDKWDGEECARCKQIAMAKTDNYMSKDILRRIERLLAQGEAAEKKKASVSLIAWEGHSHKEETGSAAAYTYSTTTISTAGWPFRYPRWRNFLCAMGWHKWRVAEIQCVFPTRDPIEIRAFEVRHTCVNCRLSYFETSMTYKKALKYADMAVSIARLIDRKGITTTPIGDDDEPEGSVATAQ